MPDSGFPENVHELAYYRLEAFQKRKEAVKFEAEKTKSSIQKSESIFSKFARNVSTLSGSFKTWMLTPEQNAKLKSEKAKELELVNWEKSEDYLKQSRRGSLHAPSKPVNIPRTQQPTPRRMSKKAEKNLKDIASRPNYTPDQLKKMLQQELSGPKSKVTLSSEMGAQLRNMPSEIERREIDKIGQDRDRDMMKLLNEQKEETATLVGQQLPVRRVLDEQGELVMSQGRLPPPRMEIQQLEMNSALLRQQLEHLEQQQKLDVEMLGRLQEKERAQQNVRHKQYSPPKDQLDKERETLTIAQNHMIRLMTQDYEAQMAPLKLTIELNQTIVKMHRNQEDFLNVKWWSLEEEKNMGQLPPMQGGR